MEDPLTAYLDACNAENEAEDRLAREQEKLARLKANAPRWWENWIFPVVTLAGAVGSWMMGFRNSPWLLLFFATVTGSIALYVTCKRWRRKRQACRETSPAHHG